MAKTKCKDENESHIKTIILEKWSIQNVLGDIRLYGIVVEDHTGRYKRYDHILSKPLDSVHFNQRVAYDGTIEYKLFGAMR